MTILYLDTNELLKARNFMLNSRVEFPYFYKLRITNFLKKKMIERLNNFYVFFLYI